MSISVRIGIFIVASLLLTYVLRIPGIIDEFHASRFAFVSLVSILGAISILPSLKKLEITLLDAMVFLFFGLYALSILWAYNFGEAIITAQRQLLLFAIYYLFRSIFHTTKGNFLIIRKTLWALTVFTLLITSYQLFMQAMSQGLGGKGIYKVIGHSGHKNTLATFLFLLLGLNVFFRKPGKQSIWFLGMIFWQIVVLFMLRSRGVYLASLVFGGGLLLYYLSTLRQHSHLIFRRVLPAIGIGLVALYLALQFLPAAKDYQKFTNPATYFDSASGKERLFVWSKTVELIKEHPWMGLGSGSWKVFFPSKSVEGGYRLQEKDVVFTRVHNDFLEVAAELGLFGLLVYLTIFGIAIWALWRNRPPTKRLNATILTATIAGFMVISFFDFPKERIEHLVLLGLVLALSARQAKNWYIKHPIYFSLSKQQATFMVSGLFLLLLSTLPTSYYRLKGDKHCYDVYDYKMRENWKGMREAATKADHFWYSVDPAIIPFSWFEGLGYYMEADYTNALGRFAKAYELNPYNFHVINNYASTLVQEGHYEKAVELYLKALAINPKFEDAMFNISYSYFQLNQFKAAKEWVSKTKSNPTKKEEFLHVINQAIQADTQ